jgi:hypothetical protein
VLSSWTISDRMKYLPISTPTTVPTGFAACAQFSRLAAVFGSPSSVINGFADVSRNASPQAITNSAARKYRYSP